MKIVVIKDMSAGNESVGEMWKETAIFDDSQPISDIINWVNPESIKSGCSLRKNVVITIPNQEEENE